MGNIKGKARSLAVAIDGSNPSWEAMRRAINMARLLELPLEVLTVIQMRKAGYFAFIDRHLLEEQEAYAKKVLSEAEDRCQKAGVEVRTHLLQSERGPSEAIVEFLEAARGIKFLVIGSYGHGFRGRHILGSTTERVVREVAHRALPVPVLVVPSVQSTE
ncbi:MAG: universal stress protein [Deltaproteobacteria bacterium]|nr:universal stress protein [Deltaproteobacteria bacterium]MBW1953328.1 universal stress protein [Deltaproteobacteria bacterium]MBW1986879.1 universal stress protein [Deltaproteobacteria bacterium]MBW2135554.1 universal stress protein [Deltaproteobacteria bacterium]